MYHLRQKQLKSLVAKLSITQEAVIKWNLLNLALTHSTVSSTHNYEKLEFGAKFGYKYWVSLGFLCVSGKLLG